MKSTFSTSEVGKLLGVAAGSVANWIDQGQIKAGRTPGGHRRIAIKDLRAFLEQQNLPLPPELAEPEPMVLIVDDERAVAQYLAIEIAAAEPTWRIQQAYDGFAAGQLVGSLKPQVMILDLRMPDLDGFEVCRRIKSDPATQSTAVIAMTAYPSISAEKKILECGAQACLTKPLDIDVLLQEVHRALRGESRSKVLAGSGREE